MPTHQNLQVELFKDYIPAELKENKTWEIVYYVINPNTNKLARKRNRVRPIKQITLRRKLAKTMINTINAKLASGWNPFYENKGVQQFKTVAEASRLFINRIEVEYNDNNLRFDTFKTYKSQLKQLNIYLTEVLNNTNLMCHQFNQEFIGNYLDYIRYTKKLSARSRDNYLGFMRTFSSFLIEKKYITENPTQFFKRINKKTKKRVVINADQKQIIFKYLENYNPNFLTLCLTCYYCLVRRTELTKLKVKHVNLHNQTLYIDAADSKNRKSAHVTIPNRLISVLQKHIAKENPEHYLFSNNNLNPGVTKLNPDMITKKWRHMRKQTGIPNTIDWYSLKDSGITDLLVSGVPLISVRDQARHHSSNQTDTYTPRHLVIGDAKIINANVVFT